MDLVNYLEGRIKGYKAEKQACIEALTENAFGNLRWRAEDLFKAEYNKQMLEAIVADFKVKSQNEVLDYYIELLDSKIDSWKPSRSTCAITNECSNWEFVESRKLLKELRAMRK